MSIEAIEETFAAMIKGLDRSLGCDVHKEEEHRAWWFFESRCPVCADTDRVAVCDAVYYQTVANKEKAIMECGGCERSFKPFDIIETTRRLI